MEDENAVIDEVENEVVEEEVSDELEQEEVIEENEEEVIPEEEAPSTPTFDHGLLMRAGQLGLDEGTVARLGNNEALSAVLETLEARQQKETQQEEAPPEEQGYKLELPDYVDEEIADALGGFAEHINQQLQQLRGHLGGVGSSVEQQQMERVVNEFDSALDGIGELNEVLGQAPATGSDQHKARAKVWEEFNVLREADARMGRHTPLSELAKKAATLAYPDQAKDAAKKSAMKRVERREGLKVSKPNEGNKSDLSNEERALKRIEEIQRARKLGPYAED